MSDRIQSYRDLQVGQKAMGLAKNIYSTTQHFPGDERFGLISQMRRSAVSVASNLAEGHARLGLKEFQHGISIALGSIAELETQVLLSNELGYLEVTAKNDLVSELDVIGKMLRGLQKSLAHSSSQLRLARGSLSKPLDPSP